MSAMTAILIIMGAMDASSMDAPSFDAPSFGRRRP
jgi:hypothetical protein